MTELSFQPEGGLGLSALAAPAAEQPFKSTAGGAAASVETPRAIQDAMRNLNGAEMITPENLGDIAAQFPATADLEVGAGGTKLADRLQEVLDREIGGFDSPNILASKIGGLEETIIGMAHNQPEPAAGAPPVEAPPAAEGSLAEGFTPLPSDTTSQEVTSRAAPPKTEASQPESKRKQLVEGAENRRTAEAGEEPTAEGTKGKAEAGGEEPPRDNDGENEQAGLPEGDGSPTHREVAAMRKEIDTIAGKLIGGEITPEQAGKRLLELSGIRDKFVQKLATEYIVGDRENMTSYEKEVGRLCSECVSLFEQVREASQILEELKNQKPIMNEQMRQLKDEQREATNAFKSFQQSDMRKENRGALYMGKLEADQKVARQAANMARHELRMRQMTTIAKDNFRKFQALNSRLERLTGSRGFFEDLAVQIMHRIENWAREAIQDEQISILARHIARKGSF